MKTAPTDPTPDRSDRVPAAHPRWRKALGIGALVAVVLVALYAALGYWWLPRLAVRDLPPWLAQHYGLRLTLGPVRFNPFRFTVDADKVDLRDADGAPLLQVEHLAVDASPSDLLHRTWTLARVTLTAPQVHLVLEKDGTLNLVELLHRLAPPSAAPAAPPPRVDIGQLEVVRGQLLFTDRRGAAVASASIAPIAFTLNDLSTEAGHKATQTLTATLPNGATLRQQGDLTLQPAVAASGRFALKALQAGTILPFLRHDLRIDRLTGSIDLASDYAYGAAPGLRLDQLAVHVADLLLGEPGAQAPLIAMKTIDATGGTLKLAERRIALAALSVADGATSLALAPDGRSNWAGLVAPAAAAAVATLPAASAASPAPSASAASPAAVAKAASDWHLAIAAVKLDRVALGYLDRQRQPPLAVTVGSVAAGLKLAVATGPQLAVTAEHIEVQLQDIAVPATSAGGPFVKVDAARMQEGSLDLGDRRFAAQVVSIEGGNVSLGKNADGTIDLARQFSPVDPGGAASTAVASTASGKWHYDLAEARVGGIGMALADRSTSPPFRYDVRVDSVTARHVANDGTAPVRFEAKLAGPQGGTLQATGHVAADGSDLDASVRVTRLALGPFDALTTRYTGLAVTGGPLTLAANVHRVASFAIDHLDVDLPKLAVRRPTGGEPLLAIAQVQARGGSVDVGKRQVAIDQLTLADGAVSARMRPDGRLDWQVAAASAAPTRVAAPAAVAPAASAPWTVRIDALKVSQMAAHYADTARPKPLNLDVDRIDLGMALQVSTGGASPQVAAKDIHAEVRAAALSLDHAKPPTLALASAQLSGGTLDLAGRRFTAKQLALTGGDTRIVRDAQGRIAPLDSILSMAPAVTPPAPTVRGNAGAGSAASRRSVPATRAAPWQYAVDTLAIREFRLAAEDRSYTPPLALAAQLNATVQHLTSAGPAAFDATLALANAGGSVQATGSASPATGSVQAHVVAKSLGLAPLQPVVSQYAALALRSGQAGSDLTLNYEPGAAGALRVSGRLDIEKLALDGSATGEHFLTLQRLDANKIDFDSARRRLAIGEVDLLAPDTRIAIGKDHRVNLGGLLGPAPAGKATASASTPAPARPAVAASAPGFAVDVQRIHIREGSVDFSDQTLVLPFATQVTGIDATIAGVSNDATRRADVQARGSIQTYGSASVDGSIVPADPRRFTDLRVKFNNVMVQPLSPYTATFAGRNVKSGKLWLDLNYKIDHDVLLGENDVRLADFTLGDRVASATALDLPLNLAVSLLTDSKGEINLSVPVRGDLGNPHFDFGDAVAHAIGNTLSRIVTAPFRLLGRLFGSADKSLDDRIDFAPGSATLAPDQREKLDALAAALKQRPQLRLVVAAPYDAAADTLALQQAATRRALAERLQQPVSSDPGSALVAFDDPATRKALQAMRAEQPGSTGASESTAPAAGADDRAAAEALFDRIARQQALSAGAPQILAKQRAGRIAEFLTEKGIERSRVTTGQVESVPVSDGKTVDARLQLSAVEP